MYESFHVFSSRTFRCEVAHKWHGERSWPELSASFFPNFTEMFSSTLWTQIANQIPAREPVCLQAHTPHPFAARIHSVREIITFQMFGEKRLLLRSHVISDFGALERGSHMHGGSHEGRREDSCPQCKVTTEALPPPHDLTDRTHAGTSLLLYACMLHSLHPDIIRVPNRRRTGVAWPPTLKAPQRAVSTPIMALPDPSPPRLCA